MTLARGILILWTVYCVVDTLWCFLVQSSWQPPDEATIIPMSRSGESHWTEVILIRVYQVRQTLYKW